MSDSEPATIQRAYKTKLVVNNHEANHFRGCAGLARFVYNWGLAEAKREYEETGKTPSARAVLKKRFNAIKDAEYPWVREYPYVITESAFDNLDLAYKHFFRRVKAGETPGYPRFKRRGDRASFRLRGVIVIEEARVKLPRIGWVRLAERGYLPAGVDVNSATISEQAGHWYISVQVEEEAPEPLPLGGVLGVEIGVRLAAVAVDESDAATVYDAPRPLAAAEKKLARLQRELSRREKGGTNWRKTQAKIARAHRRVADIRAHGQHNISAAVTRGQRPVVIAVKGQGVAEMMRRPEAELTADGDAYAKTGAARTKGRRKGMADVGMGELQRQITYKAGWAGVEVVVGEHGWANNRTCSNCGAVKDAFPLSETVFKCEVCGIVLDRDINAARNLRDLAALREPVKHGGLPGELGE